MGARRLDLRLTALLAAGAFSVHQARFALAPADAGGGRRGHGYLPILGAALAVALLIGCVRFLDSLARRETPARPTRTARVWVAATATLIAAYWVQESAEGLLTPHHPAAFAAGGTVAIPLAIVAGLLIAVALRGAAGAPALLAPPRRLRLPSLRLPSAWRGTVTAVRCMAAAAPCARSPPIASI